MVEIHISITFNLTQVLTVASFLLSAASFYLQMKQAH